MDKILYRNLSKSEVIGRRGWKNRMTTQNRQKSKAKKRQILDLDKRDKSYLKEAFINKHDIQLNTNEAYTCIKIT